MAFIGLFFILAGLVILALGALLLTGMILLIAGIVRREGLKKAGKYSPAVCIAVGSTCLILFFASIFAIWTSFLDPFFARLFVCENTVDRLLSAADAGDRDSFEKLFAPSIRERGDFEATVDAFWEAYPKGLSRFQRKKKDEETRALVKVWKTACFTCSLGGEWYYMELWITTENEASPDEVGVTFFCVENLEANAFDREYGEDEFLVCEKMDESEVSARLIDGMGYLFTPTPDRSITVGEMEAYLAEYGTLSRLSVAIGKPNVTTREGSMKTCFYELVPENGEPRYMYIRADSDHPQKIYRFYVCSDEKRIFY